MSSSGQSVMAGIGEDYFIPSPPKIDTPVPPLIEGRDVPMERDRISECRAYGDNLNASTKHKQPDKKA